MRTKILAALAAILIAAGVAARADRPAPKKLTGDMTKLHYMIGSWSCLTKTPAADKMPAQTHKGTTTFGVATGNTLGFYIDSDQYAAGGFMGESQDKKSWWISTADAFGGATWETGKGGGTSVSSMTGLSSYQGHTTPVRDTFTKISSTKYRDLYETQQKGQWMMGADSTCTKTSDKPSM